MLDLVVIDGQSPVGGIIARNLITGEIERHTANAVVLATGGYGTVYYLSTLAVNSNASAAWKAHKRGAFYANPSFIQIHPTCIPQLNQYQSKLTLMSESLRNDGRMWVPKQKGDKRPPNEIPEEDRDYFLERRYPAFGNLVPRDVASRAVKERCDAGYGVSETGLAVYLDFRDALKKQGKAAIADKYGNLFYMYKTITGIDPYEEPMRIYPAGHYTMGGLWVDYEIMTTIPGLYAIGESNFSDHGANRLGASSLMQAAGDGFFILPVTINNYLAGEIHTAPVPVNHPEFEAAEKSAVEGSISSSRLKGIRLMLFLHRRVGKNNVGLLRNVAQMRRVGKKHSSSQGTQRRFCELNVPGTIFEPIPNLNEQSWWQIQDYFELQNFL
jgi:succinate dehydrogenase / fumarate reductase flavoprotein subunit